MKLTGHMRKLLLLPMSLLAGVCVAGPPAPQVEDDGPETVKFVAPDGFGRHKWGDLRSSFERLPETPVGVGAAWMQPKEKRTDITCVPVYNPGPQISGAVGGCDFYATLLRYRKTYEGGGTYVMSEYSIEGQGFRFGSEADDIVLHPVVYQFCANWGQTRKSEPPPNFDSINKFCGVKFAFTSETRAELGKLPDEHVTTYDRILEKLIAKYGRPDKFRKRGKVVIETVEGESSDPADRKFSIWRWCPAKGDGFSTSCKSSVVLSLDPVTGQGEVMYSTPELWEFAWAREKYGFKGDRLYRILHARN
jgi:hypothetical protein